MAAFPAADGRGKWHAAAVVSGVAACGAPVILDTHADPIHATTERAHPFVCRRCWGAWRKAH